MIHYWPYLFWSSNCPEFSNGSSFKLPSMSFYHDSTVFLSSSLLSGIANGSSVSSLPSSGISLSQGAMIPSGGEWYLKNNIWVIGDWLFFLTSLLLNEPTARFFSHCHYFILFPPKLHQISIIENNDRLSFLLR